MTVPVEGSGVEVGFGSERAIHARPGQPDVAEQVVEAEGVVAVAPELGHCSIEHLIAIE